MNAPSVDIKDILLGFPELGLIFGENLHVGTEPSAPSNVVTIFDTPGRPPQLTYTKGENYEYPSIQVRVRNTNYGDAYAKAKAIQTLLHAASGILVNGVFYSLIKCTGDPFLLDRDQNNRARFVVNFDIQRR